MPLDLTTEQRALLRSDRLKARILTTWYMADGVFRYCDDVEDITLNVEGNDLTWIGAAALAAISEIKSSSGNMSAEPVTITIDGTRAYQAGFNDPAELFRIILDLPLSNRRVDIDLAIGSLDDPGYSLVLPMFTAKINNAKLVDPRMPQIGNAPQEYPQSNLVITLDSLAARYGWATFRTRSHEDQQEIDPTDMFYSYVHLNQRNESTLYWGKKGPGGASGSSYSAAQRAAVWAATRGNLQLR